MITSDLRTASFLIFLKIEDCIVFIDGAYLSLVSKFLGRGKPLKFDIKKFAIGKHNLYWHECMCNNCFFNKYD